MINQLIANGIIAGSIYALIAIGFTIIYRTVKFFHFAPGVVYTLGAYFTYSLVITSGVHTLFAFLNAIFLTTAVGIGIDRLVYFPLRKRKASNLIFLLPSFGVFVFTKNLLQILTFRNGLGNP